MQKQTELLSRQTTSAEAQLAEIYRVRIAKLEAIRLALVPLYQHLENKIEPVCFRDTCPPVEMTEIVHGSADEQATNVAEVAATKLDGLIKACKQKAERDQRSLSAIERISN